MKITRRLDPMANVGASRSQLAGERRRFVELVPAEQRDAQLLAEVVPSGIARSTLRYQDGSDVWVSESPKSMAVPQHLAEPETELSLFVLVGDALDFGDEHRSVRLPGEAFILRGAGGTAISRAAGSGVLEPGLFARRARLSGEIERGEVTPPGISQDTPGEASKD
jgi:hypothetical protein